MFSETLTRATGTRTLLNLSLPTTLEITASMDSDLSFSTTTCIQEQLQSKPWHYQTSLHRTLSKENQQSIVVTRDSVKSKTSRGEVYQKEEKSEGIRSSLHTDNHHICRYTVGKAKPIYSEVRKFESRLTVSDALAESQLSFTLIRLCRCPRQPVYTDRKRQISAQDYIYEELLRSSGVEAAITRQAYRKPAIRSRSPDRALRQCQNQFML